MYMATKKQKIRKRKTFRGGAKSWSNTGSNRELKGFGNFPNTWSNTNTRSNTGSNTNTIGLGLRTHNNLNGFLRRLEKQNEASRIEASRIAIAASRIRSATQKAENKAENNAEREMLKRWNNNNVKQKRTKHVQNAVKIAREMKRKRSPTVSEQAAEDEKREVSLKEAIEKVAGSFTDRGNANKKKLEKYEENVKYSEKITRDTELKISGLKEMLGVLKNSLPTSALQSAMSFLRGTPTATIEREIETIDNVLAIEEPYLEELKIQLELNKKDLDSFKRHQNLMKKPKL